MPVAIQIETEGFKEAEAALAGIKGAFPAAAKEAINTALLAGRTMATKAIGARYNIAAAAIKKEMDMQRATKSHLGGHLEAKGGMIPLEQFKPTVTLKKTSRSRGARKAQYVKVKILRSGSKKLVAGAFKAQGKIFERRQPERVPLFQVSTIGVPFMMGERKIGTSVQRLMQESMARRLAQQVDRYLTAKGAK